MPVSRISVVGLGKLGLCLAVVFASRQYQVIGIDVNPAVVDAVNRGKSPIYEPGLEKILRANKRRLRASTSFDDLKSTDATFVVVPTPSGDSGMFSLKYVEKAMREISKALEAKKRYHLITLVSTVMPGSMDRVVRPILERNGKICGEDFGLCYNPEFIALGDVIRGMTEPDFILIGESDKKAGIELSKIQRKICKNLPPIERMSFVNAELSKISVNSFVTMKMSFANTLAEICENIPGGDVDKVTTAIGKDKRIGGRYLKGAQGYGGPCFPRDNIAFASFAEKVGAQAELALATHSVNLGQVRRILGLLARENILPPKSIGILGLSYKPNTNVVEASQSLLLAEELKKAGYTVVAYDPSLVVSRGEDALKNIEFAASAEACIDGAEACILATPWKEFSKIPGEKFAGKIVIDLWRTFSEKAMHTPIKYIAIGRSAITEFPSEYLVNVGLQPEVVA